MSGEGGGGLQFQLLPRFLFDLRRHLICLGKFTFPTHVFRLLSSCRLWRPQQVQIRRRGLAKGEVTRNSNAALALTPPPSLKECAFHFFHLTDCHLALPSVLDQYFLVKLQQTARRTSKVLEHQRSMG